MSTLQNFDENGFCSIQGKVSDLRANKVIIVKEAQIKKERLWIYLCFFLWLLHLRIWLTSAPSEFLGFSRFFSISKVLMHSQYQSQSKMNSRSLRRWYTHIPKYTDFGFKVLNLQLKCLSRAWWVVWLWTSSCTFLWL